MNPDQMRAVMVAHATEVHAHLPQYDGAFTHHIVVRVLHDLKGKYGFIGARPGDYVLADPGSFTHRDGDDYVTCVVPAGRDLNQLVTNVLNVAVR